MEELIKLVETKKQFSIAEISATLSKIKELEDRVVALEAKSTKKTTTKKKK